MTASTIDERGLLRLGGFPQRLHLLADRPGLPGLLVLHGGPGFPNRHLFTGPLRELARHFTLILWDQRGTGGSWRGSWRHPLTLETLIADAHELTVRVRRHLHLDQVFVLGQSWGTELGVRLVQAHPGAFAGYAGTGQAVSGVGGELLSWEHARDAATAAGDQAGLRLLKRVGPPRGGLYTPVLDGLIAQRRVLSRHDPYGGGGALLTTARTFFGDPEYTLADRVGVAAGHRSSLARLWPLIVRYDFRRDATSLPVPVVIAQGRHDWTTPAPLVAEWVDALDAPDVRLHWFERSSHSVVSHEADRFVQVLVDGLLGARRQSA